MHGSPTTGTGEDGGRTRLIAMGGAALMEGFDLIGFETWPDAGTDDVERVLAELLRHRRQAVVFLEPALARSDGPLLRKVRNEGGRIVVTEVPRLHAPGDYHPEVEGLVASILGASALEGGHE